jgi:hypothetical protein
MNNERFYTSIGLFVSGAILIIIASTFFWYTKYFQGRVETYVMFFKGSLNGLETKSIITYRGVKIGEVKRIELTANKANTNVAIPVYVTFFIEKSFVQRNNPIDILIDNGVKASITSPNILTGTASIQLLENKKGAPFSKGKTFHGFPMYPTDIIQEDNEALDTIDATKKTLKDISEFIRSRDFKDTVLAIKGMANSVDRLSMTLTQKSPTTLYLIEKFLVKWSDTADATKQFSNDLARHPESIIRGNQ